MQTWYLCLFHTQVYCIVHVCIFPHVTQKCVVAKKKIVISGKSMTVRPESVTHLVVKLFNVKSKFDYIDENKQKSEIANNDKFERPRLSVIQLILSRPNATYIYIRGNTLRHVHS
jgi:hypothetical protein